MNLANLQNLKTQVLIRAKAAIALLGLILFYLQALETAQPNHYVSLAIGVLTVLGVHQVSNQETK